MPERFDDTKYPKTWEEFRSKSNLKLPKGFHPELFLSQDQEIAESYFALGQLRLLRKTYVGEWQPPYGKGWHSIIELTIYGWRVWSNYGYPNLFTFPNEDMARAFLHRFIDLFTKIEPLFR